VGLSANAGTCTAGSFTDPDATVTNSTSCGPGYLNDANDSAAEITALVGGGDWDLINRVNAPGSTSGVLHTTGLNPAGSSGDWAFNAVAGFSSYLLVIKDGSVKNPDQPNNSADTISWFWFVIDMSAGCSSGSFSGSYDYCGSWSMYGNDGKLKSISHLTLYGLDTDGDDDEDVPEPGSLALLGLGLLGLGAARRRRV